MRYELTCVVPFPPEKDGSFFGIGHRPRKYETEATRSQRDIPSIIRWYETARFFCDRRTSATMKPDPHIERKAVMRGATWKKVSSQDMVLVLVCLCPCRCVLVSSAVERLKDKSTGYLDYCSFNSLLVGWV